MRYALIALALAACPVVAEPLNLEQKVDLLIASYPEAAMQRQADQLVLGEQRFAIDDGELKTDQQRLDRPDIEDMLSLRYPLLACQPAPASEAGRVRVEPLFRGLYGSSKQQAREGLVAVDWFGQQLQVSRRHGAAQALKKVAAELAEDATLKKFLTPSAGTFNWRKIAGTQRLSVHSFGAAIDLNVSYANYWRWRKDTQRKKFANRYPLAIVGAFERHGYIWGGNWYHYDTMHFEYRPELIAIARAEGCDQPAN